MNRFISRCWVRFVFAASISMACQLRASVSFDTADDESLFLFHDVVSTKLGCTERTGKFVVWNPENSRDEMPAGFDRHESQDMRTLREGLCCIEVDGKWGYVNGGGKIEIQPQFEDAFPFREGHAWVKINGKWGAINHSGRFSIPAKFDYASVFRSGSARVQRDGK